ncbi:hypothetical protein B5M09_013312, partial [Aphanomyces astaci]
LRGTTGLGLLYLVATLASSFYYITLVVSSTSNDLWQPHFNSSGVHTFIGNVYHARLALTPSTPLDLFAVVVQKEYAGSATFMDISPSFPRLFWLDNIPLQAAVTSMRSNNFGANMRMFSQYCWADFNQRYEMVHTLLCQARCLVNDADNAGVYFEALLRNVGTAKHPRTSTCRTSQHRVCADSGGDWVRSTSLPWLAVGDEVDLWQSHGLLRWKTQLQNIRELGVVEPISIVNALGMSTTIEINKTPTLFRGMNLWSTAYASAWNDLRWGFQHNFSLILNTPTNAVAKGIDWDADLDIGYDQTPILSTVRQFIEPFNRSTLSWWRPHCN